MESGLAVVRPDAGQGVADQTGKSQQARKAQTKYELVGENQVGYASLDILITISHTRSVYKCLFPAATLCVAG